MAFEKNTVYALQFKFRRELSKVLYIPLSGNILFHGNPFNQLMGLGFILIKKKIEYRK